MCCRSSRLSAHAWPGDLAVVGGLCRVTWLPFAGNDGAKAPNRALEERRMMAPMTVTTALLLTRLGLAILFLVATLGKMLDRAGGVRAMTDFGVPRVLAAPAAIVLPLAELAVAVALLLSQTAWWGSLGAAFLLMLFVAGIAINLARGRAPECHCFGQFHSKPAGWQTLARNLMLAAAAGFVIAMGPAHPQRSVIAWAADLSAATEAGLALGAASLSLAAAVLWFLLQVIAQNGRLLLRLDALEQQLASTPSTPSSSSVERGQGAGPMPPAGLPVGTTAPGFSLRGLFGETQTLDALRAAGGPLLLFFTDPNCGPCQALLPDIARWQRELAPTATLVLISRGNAEENRAKSSEHGLVNVLLQEDREVAIAYKSYGTPGAVLVLSNGRIGSPVAQGAEQIRALVARVAGSRVPLAAPALVPVPAAQAPTADGHGTPCPNCGRIHGNGAGPAMPEGPVVGTPAPALRLPDLDGREVDLADFRGRETLVLFWNPGCGFCQRMLPDLK
jgi:peroxiredoxin